MNNNLNAIKKSLLVFTFFFVQLNFAQNTNYIRKADQFYKNYGYDSAYIYYKKTIPYFKNNSPKIKGEFYIKYSKILKVLSKADSSFFYLDLAEKIFSSNVNKNLEQLFYIKTLKAETSRYLFQKENSASYIQQAQKLYNPNFDTDKIAYFFNRKMAINCAFYFNIKDSIKSVYKDYNKILQLENKIRDKSILVYSINEIAFLDFNSSPKKAYINLKKAFDVAKKYNTELALIDVSRNIGMYFQQKEANFIQAIKYHQLALKYAKKINNLQQIREAYYNLRCCYYLNKDLEKAIAYTDSNVTIQNQINKYENANLINEIEIKNNIKNKEIELKESKKTNLLIILILIAVIISLFALFYYSSRIRNKNKILSNLIKENEFLISETNHRVNNNLQIISILISETLRKKQSEENRVDFTKLLSKVETIASLHRHLYQTKTSNEIDLQKYLFDISSNFSDIKEDHNLEINFEIEPIQIHSDNAMYFGLLTTELIINSVKHAFDYNQKKTIKLVITTNNSAITFDYSDNGLLAIGKTIQPILVTQLCQQLQANPTIETSNGFHLYFKL